MPTASQEAPAPKTLRTGEKDGTHTGRPSRPHSDVVIAGGIIAFCTLVWGGTLTFDEVPAALAQGMGAEAFPRLVLCVLTVLAIGLALASRGRADPEREPIHRLVLLTAAATLAFMVVLKIFGIYGAIAFAFLGIGRLWGERRWLLLAATGVGLVVATHLMFVTGFGIPLPKGVIGTWLT
jgi:Tripartite tricarboxylate transporter TctB family